jgi:hypothetical protein
MVAIILVEFEVLMVVSMKMAVFWAIAPYGMVAFQRYSLPLLSGSSS